MGTLVTIVQTDESGTYAIASQYQITFSTSKTVVSGEFEVDNPPFGSKNIETGEFAAKIPPTPPQSCTVIAFCANIRCFIPIPMYVSSVQTEEPGMYVYHSFHAEIIFRRRSSSFLTALVTAAVTGKSMASSKIFAET